MIELPGFGRISVYWVGVLGSIVVEVFALSRDCANLDGRLPTRYRRGPYLLSRILVAAASGVLPLVFDAPSALAAFYLGVSAPLVIDKLAQGVLPPQPDAS